MLHALLHRGRSFRDLAGNQLFVRGFSSTTLACNTSTKQAWREVFEDIFEPSGKIAKRFSKMQFTELLPLLPSKVKKMAAKKGERQKALKGSQTENRLQKSEDEDLLQVFRNLIKQLNVDHAILLCAKLPANRLQTGIDTLIRVCLEGVYEAKYKDELTDKIFDLLEQCKSKGCTPSEAMRNTLVKWLLDSGNASRAQCLLRLLQNSQHSNVPEAEHSEDCTSQGWRKESDIVTRKTESAKSWSIIGKELSRFPNELGESQVTAKTQMKPMVQLLGSSRHQEHLSDNVELLGVKGVSNSNLVVGLTEETRGSPENIKKLSQASKKIDEVLNFGTNTSFNRMIAYCATRGEIARCIELIQTMKSIGLQPCAASYEPLVAFFAGTLEISKAEDILRMMRKSGLHATKRAYECLIVAYTKSDNLEKAFNLLEEIPLEELVPDLYSPLIYSYGIMGKISCALSVFRQMRLKNVKPNTQNFASLIHTCGIRRDLRGAEKVFQLFKKQNSAEESEELVLSAMMRVYAACGSDEQIEKVMSCTCTKSLFGPEAMTALLKGFAEGGKIQKAIQIYNQIRYEGNWPDPRTFLSFLFSLGRAGELDLLLELLDPFKKSIQTRNRVSQDNLASGAYCTIVHALIRHNQLEKALDFLQKIQTENAGDVETLCLKVFTLDKCDTSSLQHEQMSLEDKLEFLSAMRDRLKVQPTRLAYESLLESCAREKNFVCADRVLRMMKSDNLVLNVFTYLILLRIVVASGNLEMLNSFLPKMRRAVGDRGLQDDHVKLLVMHILNGANVHISGLNGILYPSSEIRT